VQTLASRAVEENGSIAKDIVDQAIHCGFGKGATLVFSTGKSTGTLDLFCEKVVDVYSSAGSRYLRYNDDMATY
jgi:acid phosphatase class B